MTKTITRADLGDAVYQTVGLSRNESAKLVEQVLDEVVEALIRGEAVKLSSFGSFMVRKKLAKETWRTYLSMHVGSQEHICLSAAATRTAGRLL